ncbi:DUF4832 domain-containing protein [Rubripirellula tenax]|uniref:DUF4832 domain-containing protein n=1 Tax=Rubripirellula tenax TaxID=2528015 RepID=UPI0011B7E212|nr:DUF4832 domain-containing protein [Rubripirellula tenax]
MNRRRWVSLLATLGCLLMLVRTGTTVEAQPSTSARFTPAEFVYEAGPADNPLKGLVPYQGPHPDRFPYSMEFNYLPLSAIVKGPGQYEWRAFEQILNDVASRGHQTVTRIFLEYPGKEGVIPTFLVEGGLKVHRYLNTNTAPFPPAAIETPDYGDPNLRKVMTDFITAWGKRYDGDPRLAYITAGMLGTWGEWHTYPKTELWASKEVQKEVLDAFDRSFRKTPVLLRYPAGKDDYLYTDSTPYRFGYHDDSFAHSTLDTGRPEDEWYFWPKMKTARLSDRWQTAPIGGEIRPEVWGCCFDEKPCTEASQSFDECRDVTHATWLMDTGMNQEQPSPDRYARAVKAVQKMGYDFEVTRAGGEAQADGSARVDVTLTNRGIAPFYHHGWAAELLLIHDGKVFKRIATDWSPREILPGESKTFQATIDAASVDQGEFELQLVIPNPMKGGRPLRFANRGSDATTGALTLGAFAK